MKKIFATILLVTLICAVFTGCNKNQARQATAEEAQAIQDVIKAFDKAYYYWDAEGMRACVTEEYFNTIESQEAISRGAFTLYLDTGDMVEEDFGTYMEIEKKNFQQGVEQLQYRNWDITVSEDTATAKITYGYPDIESDKVLEGKSQKEYRDNMFMSICGMDEVTAKKTLSPKEFSSVYLQVFELNYIKRSENSPYIENVTELRLKNIDGKWYISEFVLPEE